MPKDNPGAYGRFEAAKAKAAKAKRKTRDAPAARTENSNKGGALRGQARAASRRSAKAKGPKKRG